MGQFVSDGGETHMNGTDRAARIEALLAEMNLDEKIGQLNMVSADLSVSGPGRRALPLADISAGLVGSVLNWWGARDTREIQRRAVEETRLGIPLFFGFDVIHGQRTIFPIPLAEAGAFDTTLWERTARVAAQEAAEDGLHLTFAPMLDVARDPRWGRIAETPGEDAFLGAAFADAKVRAFQNGDLSRNGNLAATAKHFVAYGLVNAGREYAQVDVSERALRDVYLPPFRAAVEAGAAAIMPAFTDIAGLPMHAHRELLFSLVRERWGFEGVFISDYSGIAELVNHGVAADLVEAAALALKAGVDIDMMGFAYLKGLPGALERGLVSMAEIDVCVRRVLGLKFALGLFDDPYRACAGDVPDFATRALRRALARESGARSIVLLKNRHDILPHDAGHGTLAVVGPLADARHDMLGPWCALGDQDESFALLDGLYGRWPREWILHAPGATIDTTDETMIESACAAARGADCVILCLGESRSMSGEAGSRADPSLPAAQLALAKAVMALEKPVVAILFGGRPLILPDWLVEASDALIAAWFPGSEAGHALADILTGVCNPSARLAATWPMAAGQIPIWFGQRPTGRPADAKEMYSSKYIDAPVEPRFAFGEGLSYTNFLLGDPQPDRAVLQRGETMSISVCITNAGSRRGRQTLFLFTRDPVASLSRPLLELKGFRQIDLDAGETGTVTFELAADDLAFTGCDLSSVLEDGCIEIHIGFSARRTSLRSAAIELKTSTDATA